MVNTKIMLEYLTELENNNNRKWYHNHKDIKDEATNEFNDLVQELMIKINTFDNTILIVEPKDLTFKMVRDTRFSKDKSPYNPCFRAHISSKGKLPIPVGYFITIRPHGQSFLGGGLFADKFKDATKMIRDYIAENEDQFLAIIHHPTFKNNFKINGTKLKKVPLDYDANSKVAEYLKYKSMYIEYFIEDEDVADAEQFINVCIEKFAAMKAFNDFLNQALIDFKMPER